MAAALTEMADATMATTLEWERGGEFACGGAVGGAASGTVPKTIKNGCILFKGERAKKCRATRNAWSPSSSCTSRRASPWSAASKA